MYFLARVAPEPQLQLARRDDLFFPASDFLN